MLISTILLTLRTILGKRNNQLYTMKIDKVKVDDILVRHEWKSNHYVVEYSDGKGDSRTVRFDHTGEELFVDEYIDSEAWKIVNAYESSIEQKIEENSWKNRGKLVGPIIHCSPVLTKVELCWQCIKSENIEKFKLHLK